MDADLLGVSDIRNRAVIFCLAISKSVFIDITWPHCYICCCKCTLLYFSDDGFVLS